MGSSVSVSTPSLTLQDPIEGPEPDPEERSAYSTREVSCSPPKRRTTGAFPTEEVREITIGEGDCPLGPRPPAGQGPGVLGTPSTHAGTVNVVTAPGSETSSSVARVPLPPGLPPF